MKVLFYFLLLGLALDHICGVPLSRQIDREVLEVLEDSEEDVADEGDNEEEENAEAESGSGSGSKRNLIEAEVKEDEENKGEDENASEKDTIADAKDSSDDSTTTNDAGNEEPAESQEEKSESKEEPSPEDSTEKEELAKKNEVPLGEDSSAEEGNTEDNSETEESKRDEQEDAPMTDGGDEDESAAEQGDNDAADSSDDGNKRSSLSKRWGDEEGDMEHGHHHGHHEHEHDHHHHGHHHGFVHEWGEEEGGGHQGHEGHGHHMHEHEHEHEHEHGMMGHHGGGCGGGYGGGGGGGYGDGGCGGGYGGGYGGWGRSDLPSAPPMAFHCRDMISADGKKHTKRFCVPIGYNGGYGFPYFHGYPGVGLGQWGWGFPWIKSKINKGKGGKVETNPTKSKKGAKKSLKSKKKQQRDVIATKKQTVHVGYGYASGDNYRLGYSRFGMGGLASSYTGQLGPASFDNEHIAKKSFIQKRQYAGGVHPGLGAGYGGHSQPYGHPVTHPGFTTMGFPGHALASTDVRSQVMQRPKRDAFDEGEFPEDLLQEQDSDFEVSDPEEEYAHYQYLEGTPEQDETQYSAESVE